jgi:26S proteasome regulatory subunit N9
MASSSSSAMQVDDSTATSSARYLSSAASSVPPSLQPYFARFSELSSKKLYYQLLLSVQEFYAHPDSDQPGSTLRYDVFTKFVINWKDKVSELSGAELAIAAAKQLKEPSKALDFLSKQRDELPDKTPPHLLVSMECTHYKLLLGELETVKKDVDQGGKVLNNYDAVEKVVSGGYYRVAAEYYKAKALYQQYYTSSLLYLACLPHNGTEDDLLEEEKVERAHDLAIAAILGQGIWNFGELVSTARRIWLEVQALSLTSRLPLFLLATDPPSSTADPQLNTPCLPPRPPLGLLIWLPSPL